MLISVIIPTYNREQHLCQTIADVIKQDYPNFEILVIDQTPTHTPETENYLQDLAQAQKINWFRVNWANLPAARNYGIKQAKGDLILFIDDDVLLPDGFLIAHTLNYQSEKIGAVAGRVLDRLKLDDSKGKLIIEDLPPEANDPGIAWYHLDLVHTIKPQPVISARGCNMSFRKEIFTKYQLTFDERFKGSAVREESDFCLRLRQTGYIIWYDPQASLVHLGEITGGCHDLSVRSISYQITFYHNHFLMGLKNLTPKQCYRFFTKLFDCHVLGHPPCYKSGSPLKIITRFGFYILGFFSALITLVK